VGGALLTQCANLCGIPIVDVPKKPLPLYEATTIFASAFKPEGIGPQRERQASKMELCLLDTQTSATPF
jgi:hypothetical protein